MDAARRGRKLLAAGGLRHRPFETVRIRRGEPREPPARDDSREGESGEDLFHGDAAHRSFFGSHREDFGAGLPYEEDDGGRHDAFDEADREMDRLHQQHEGPERQLRNSGGDCFQDDREGPELQADQRGQRGGDEDRPRGRKAPGDLLVDKRIREKAREEAHVEDVAPKREKPSIREEERLDDEDGGERQKGRVGPQQNRQDHPPSEMAARSRGRNAEVDHLRREDERAQNPHQRNPRVVGRLLQLFRRVRRQPGRHRPHRAADRRGKQRIRHVHRKRPPS